MKEFKLISLLFIFLSGKLIGQPASDAADHMDMEATPSELNIRHGVLSNGLKYYIHHSDKENIVRLHLLIKAGFDHEDADQTELSHLLEHMAFVKTKHFVNAWEYFAGKGLKGGSNINAFTRNDNTDYMLVLPSANRDLIRDGFLFLSDCAQGIILEKTRTDSERNVVIEELRGHDSYASNLAAQISSSMMPMSGPRDATAAERMNAMAHYKFRRLKDFYNDWYRPELQAVIVSGNIDVDDAEQYIKSMFSGLQGAKKPIKHTVSSKRLMPGDPFKIFIDRDSEDIEFKFYSMHTDRVEASADAIRLNALEELSHLVMQNRLSEFRLNRKIDFMVYRFNHRVSKNIDGYLATTGIRTKPDSIKSQFQKAIVEIERICRHGITSEELASAKESFLTDFKIQNKADSKAMTGDMIDLFLNDTPLPDRAAIEKLVMTVVNSISYKDIQAVFKQWVDMDHQRIVIIASGSAKEELPDRPVLANWILEARRRTILPFTGDAVWKELMTSAELAHLESKKVEFAETELTELGVTKLVLPNGVQVFLKPLKAGSSEDRIRFQAARQRESLLRDEMDILALRYATRTIVRSGLGKLNAFELGRLLKNRNVKVSPDLQKADLGLRGQCSSGELETMLQLVNRHFISPRADESIFNDLVAQAKRNDGRESDNLQSEFYDLCENFFAAEPTKHEILSDINFQEALDIYKENFGNAGEFIFVFAGDFNTDEAKTLIAKYLGDLPSDTNRKPAPPMPGSAAIKAVVDSAVVPEGKTVYAGKENMAEVRLFISGSYVHNELNNIKLGFLGRALHSVLRTRLRERDGDVYYFLGTTAFSKERNRYAFVANFSCDPGKVDKIVASAKEEIEMLKNHGVSAAVYEEILSGQKNDYNDKLRSPDFWTNYLVDQTVGDQNIMEVTRYIESIEETDRHSVKELAVEYLSKAQTTKFVLMPAAKEN